MEYSSHIRGDSASTYVLPTVLSKVCSNTQSSVSWFGVDQSLRLVICDIRTLLFFALCMVHFAFCILHFLAQAQAVEIDVIFFSIAYVLYCTILQYLLLTLNGKCLVKYMSLPGG